LSGVKQKLSGCEVLLLPFLLLFFLYYLPARELELECGLKLT